MSQEATPPEIDPTSPPAAGRLRPAVRSSALRASLLIGIGCLLVYNANLRSISAGDTYPTRYLPFAILKYHTVTLDPVAKVSAQGRGDSAYWMVPRPDGHVISLYPVVGPVLVAPLYLPAALYLNLRGWTDARLDHVAKVMEKLTASFLAAFSVSLLYLLLRRRAKPTIALLLTLAYAFGTTTWVIGSQALWQHGMAGLLVIGALLILTAPCTAPRALAAGLLLGLMAGNRPPDLILGAALGVYGLFWAGRRRALLLAGAAALPMLLVLFYNLGLAGNVGGGYGLKGKAHFLQHELLPGVCGLLFSPARGLFVFSPFLLFLALAWRHRPPGREERRLTLAMCVGILLQVLLYAKSEWKGGLSWGPRYMTDFLPFLVWMLVPVVTALRGAGRALFLLAVAAAVGIEAIGAFWYTGLVDLPLYSIASGPDRDRAAWAWRHAPFVSALNHGLAPAELTYEMRGSFDAVESGGRAISAVPAGQPVSATGWALAGSTTPRQVAVMIDGRGAGSSETFFDRPDVRETLRETSPAGWRVPIDTTGLAPGEHRLTVLAWGSRRGEGHYLADRDLTVLPPGAPGEAEAEGTAGASPAPSAAGRSGSREAISRLREHQQAAGTWLTAFTGRTRFHEPHPEMNTFVTALLVDLLDPVAPSSGLEDALQRSRRHLSSQIEPGGLVRYHGLPDGPGIGTLGCAITPDSDSTALVWRIAPGADRSRRKAARSTLDRYRTPEGLYRTWLAPRDAYQCLDPGRDPNPADVAIQMHLLLLLAKTDPPAARALHGALEKAIDEDEIWVYYRHTPLVPLLRLADLRRAGYPVSLPAARMTSPVPGQEVWVSACRMLDRLRGGGPPPGAGEVESLLRKLSADGFAAVRSTPPLLYHNDLSATVSRYYWSEDVGYALWLRLQFENGRRR